MLHEAADTLTAFASFPTAQWEKSWLTNPLERVKQGDQTAHRRRRSPPQPIARLRLAGSVLIETYDEWQVTTAAPRR